MPGEPEVPGGAAAPGKEEAGEAKGLGGTKNQPPQGGPRDVPFTLRPLQHRRLPAGSTYIQPGNGLVTLNLARSAKWGGVRFVGRPPERKRRRCHQGSVARGVPLVEISFLPPPIAPSPKLN